jgi:hypothetical protein
LCAVLENRLISPKPRTWSTGADGRAQFQALATVAYDDATHTYRFRAYNDGHYLDTELTVLADGFPGDFNPDRRIS